MRLWSSLQICAKNYWDTREFPEPMPHATHPNSWLMTRFCARTPLLAIPLSWPLRSMCMAS
jgi:hypothetical protein